jgi:hypothetical protein
MDTTVPKVTETLQHISPVLNKLDMLLAFDHVLDGGLLNKVYWDKIELNLDNTLLNLYIALLEINKEYTNPKYEYYYDVSVLKVQGVLLSAKAYLVKFGGIVEKSNRLNENILGYAFWKQANLDIETTLLHFHYALKKINEVLGC